MELIRIQAGTREVSRLDPPPKLSRLGGRAFTSSWVAREVPPGADALGPRNHLVIAPGLLAGTPSSSVHRLSVGAKSPLTGGIKESNSGGDVALKLARLGIKALVLEGAAETDELSVLRISADGVTFEPAKGLVGQGCEKAAAELHRRYGPNMGLMIVGPAGEMLMPTASIVNSDRDGHPSRLCGRGGLGAVLAAKGIKAVVVDDSGCKPLRQADPQRFKLANKAYISLLRNTPQTSEIYTKFGTAAMTDYANELGGLPTRNFRRGRFAGAENITGSTLYRVMKERGGDPSHACMPGCVICSSNIYVDDQGREIVRSLEYETLVLFGPNLDIDDLDELAHINRECNDLGIDTIDLGVAMGVIMEAGLVPFGDVQAVKDLLGQVRQGTVLGRLLGAGAAITGKVLGVRHVPAVKGQAMAAYEPRAIKGHGTTFATSTMGADHTAGFTIREGLNSHSPEGQVNASAKMQVNAMIYDSIGLCLFAHVAVRDNHHTLAEMVSAQWGWEMDEHDMRSMAVTAMETERQFNLLNGLGPAQDRLPESFTTQPNPDTGTVFDVSNAEIDKLRYS
jgi:aldehyde:ferredoxin oxidoreductase